MTELSPGELMELGRQYNINLGEGEADNIVNQVNDKINELETLPGYESHTNDVATADRRWFTLENNPHNAITVGCEIIPVGDNTGHLDGLSIGIKDAISVANVPLTCGSEVLVGYIPSSDATVVQRILKEGGNITAKTNLDEFVSSPYGTTSHKGAIKNPYDPSRTAGGSSGGSAVAVAMGHVDAALGTDTGGSIRIPASYCGILGLKPTYGLVPLTGIIENTYTLDHVGPMANSLENIARVLETIAGKERRDSASMYAAGRNDYNIGGYVESVSNPPNTETLKLGILENGFEGAMTKDVVDHTFGTIDRLQQAGVEVINIRLPNYSKLKVIKDHISYPEVAEHWRASGAAYRRGCLINECEQVSIENHIRAANHELGSGYRDKVLTGAYIVDRYGGRYYTRARNASQEIKSDLAAKFDDIDVLAMPTAAGIAPDIQRSRDVDYDIGQNTRLANLSGYPAISVPNGVIESMPIGLQLMSGPFEERILIGAAAAIEPLLDVTPEPESQKF